MIPNLSKILSATRQYIDSNKGVISLVKHQHGAPFHIGTSVDKTEISLRQHENDDIHICLKNREEYYEIPFIYFTPKVSEKII